MSNQAFKKVEGGQAKLINTAPIFVVLAMVFRDRGPQTRQPIGQFTEEDKAKEFCQQQVKFIEDAITKGGLFSYWLDGKHIMTIANVKDILNFQCGLVKAGGMPEGE